MSAFAIFTVSKSDFDAATGETTFEIRTEQMRVTHGDELHVNEFDSSIANDGNETPLLFELMQYPERLDTVLLVRVDESGEILDAHADGVDADNAEDHVHLLYLQDVFSLFCQNCQVQMGQTWERPVLDPDQTGLVERRHYSLDAQDQQTARVSITTDNSWNPLDLRDELIELDSVSNAQIEWDTHKGIALSFSSHMRHNIAFWERRGRKKSLWRSMSDTTVRISRADHNN
ncbi:MAG: hypothetical protein AAGD00_02375 [Planctomycetota bacterium]